MAAADDSSAPHVRVPATVYVMWHPSYTEGALLASAIYDWLGPRRTDLRRLGLGMNVFFRSEDWQAAYALDGDPLPVRPEGDDTVARADHAARNRIRRPIHFGGADLNLLVPLIDPHMLLDRSWQRDLRAWGQLHTGTDPVRLAPVQLVDSLESLGPTLRSIQPIRIDSWREADTPESSSQRTARRIVRLRREVVQLLLRALGAHRSTGAASPLRRVFLSHAKSDGADGAGVAEALRDVGRAYGHIETFYDDTELQPGTQGRAQVIRANAAHSEAFVAVLSDRYATGTWTREELALARTPQVAAAPVPGVTVWSVRPTVAVTTLQGGWTQIPDDLATVPVMRFEPGREHDVFDQVMREATVQAYQLRWAEAVAHHWASHPDTADFSDVHVVTWTPDRPTLTALRAEAIRRQAWPQTPGQRALVVYPGFGFLPGEEHRLERDFGAEMVLRSFDRLLSPPPSGTYTGMRVWLSAGDCSAQEAAARGYDAGRHIPETDLQHAVLEHIDPQAVLDRHRTSVHLDAALLRVLRRLVPHTDIAFAGDLRGRDHGFDRQLHDILADRSILGSPRARPHPLRVFTPWPACRPTTADTQARLLRLRAAHAPVARFYDVPPLGETLTELGSPSPQAPADHTAWRAATALTHTRRLIATRTDVTVAVAGRITGYSGLLPGIFEEVLSSILASVGRLDALGSPLSEDPHGPHPRPEAPDPQLLTTLRTLSAPQVSVVLLGEFGGATRLLVQAIQRPVGSASLPMLTHLAQLNHPGNQARLGRVLREGGAAAQAYVARAYTLLTAALEGLQAIARQPPEQPLDALGMTVATWCQLMTVGSVHRIGQLLGQLRPTASLPMVRRHADTETVPLLHRALVQTLRDGVPSVASLQTDFPRAAAADDGALVQSLTDAHQQTLPPQPPPGPVLDRLALALHHHIGVHNASLWRFLADARPNGHASVAAALATIGHAPPLPASPTTTARLGLHIVWQSEDPVATRAATHLSRTFAQLGDAGDRPGEGVEVRHWPWRAWPPPHPTLADFEDNVLVVLWSGQALLDTGLPPIGAWTDAVRRFPRLRAVQAIHADRTETLDQLGVGGGHGYRRVGWVQGDGPAELPADLLAAVAWAVTLALEPPPAPQDRSIPRRPVVLDHRLRGPTRRAASPSGMADTFAKRQCLVYVDASEGLAEAPAIDATAVSVPDGQDILLLDAAHPDAGLPDARPRVVVGRAGRSTPDARWAGTGRLTLPLRRPTPHRVLAACHLVAARQTWLKATIERSHPEVAGWTPMVAPTLLTLCQQSLQGTTTVRVPEPAPTALDRRALASTGSTLTVHTPTTALGRVLSHQTIDLVLTAPSPEVAAACGLPADHLARTARVLRAVFSHAGATIRARDALEASDPPRVVVVVGMHEPVDAEDPALATLHTWCQNPRCAIYPLGLAGGLFGRAGALLGAVWPDAWTALSAHNGLNAQQTRALAHTVDPWTAARQVLAGVGALRGGGAVR